MYFYEIGYYTYEESEYYTLYSEKKYTQEELEDIIVDAIIKSKPQTKEELFKNEYGCGISFEYLISSKTIEILSEIGLKPIKYEAAASWFGWHSIDSKYGHMWKEHTDGINSKLEKAILSHFDKLGIKNYIEEYEQYEEKDNGK